jgi:cell division protein FtsB
VQATEPANWESNGRSVKIVIGILLLLLVLLQIRLWTGSGSVEEISRLEMEIAEQTLENATLEARNSSLMEEVGDLRNGLDSIEERARNELGLIRKGETFYLIVEDAPEQGAAPLATVEAQRLPAPERTLEVMTEPAPEFAPQELPPEIAEDDNPYLELFRDEEESPGIPADSMPPAGQAAGR